MNRHIIKSILFESVLHCVLATTGTYAPPSTCMSNSGMTAFPECDFWFNMTNVCENRSPKERMTCACNQAVFDSIYGCASEERPCLMNNEMDSSWESAVASWHSFCDSIITFTPTTPLDSTLTTTWTPQDCLDVNNACESAKASVDACSPYLSDVTRFSSCTCQPNILTLDYSCFYLANISCYGTAATLSNMFDYSWCDNFQAVIGTGLSTTNVVTVTLPSSPSSSQASPGITASSTPTATTTFRTASSSTTTSASSSASSTLKSLARREAPSSGASLFALIFLLSIIVLQE